MDTLFSILEWGSLQHSKISTCVKEKFKKNAGCLKLGKYSEFIQLIDHFYTLGPGHTVARVLQ